MSSEKGLVGNAVETIKSYFQPTIQATPAPTTKEILPVEPAPFPEGKKDPNLEGLILALQKYKSEEAPDEETTQMKKFNRLKKLLRDLHG